MRRVKESGRQIQVLVAEPCRLSCELMASALWRFRKHLSVVACATDSAQVLKGYEVKKPDVCVISAHLRDGKSKGLTVTRELHAANKGTRVLILVDTPDRTSVVEAFQSGALGVFPRDGAFGELHVGIRKVSAGQIWASNEQLQYLVESLAAKSNPTISDVKGNSLLTEREQSLVDLVAEGLTNREISRELKLSEHTVRNYLFRIFNKLGTSNRLELAIYAINHKGSNERAGYASVLTVEQ